MVQWSGTRFVHALSKTLTPRSFLIIRQSRRFHIAFMTVTPGRAVDPISERVLFSRIQRDQVSFLVVYSTLSSDREQRLNPMAQVAVTRDRFG